MAMKKKSLKGKGGYARYKSESRVAKNKAAKLQRHLKAHPNDSQAEKAVKTASSHTGRSAPKRNGSRFGMSLQETTIVTAKGKKITKLVPVSINRSSGRLSSDGKRQQQFMSMMNGMENAYKFLAKSGKMMLGDRVVDRDAYFKSVGQHYGIDSEPPKKAKRGKKRAKRSNQTSA